MEKLIQICSSCKKVKLNGDWISEEHPLYSSIINNAKNFTDGYCPFCVDLYKKQIAQRREQIAHRS